MAKNPGGNSDPLSPSGAHRGNKASLPSKLCAACGLTMTWRRSWARNWEGVKYCSERCRRIGKG